MDRHTTGSSFIPSYLETTSLTLPSHRDNVKKIPMFSPTPWIVSDEARNIIEIDPSQAWFWSKGWQKAFNIAEEDIREGRYRAFHTIDDLLADLDNDDND